MGTIVRKNGFFITIGIMGILFLSVFSFLNQNNTTPIQFTQNSQPESQDSNQIELSNPLSFWETELTRVESTALNTVVLSTSSFEYNGKHITQEEIAYDSPNWVNQTKGTLRIRATIYYPPNYGSQIDTLPGILFMHGLYNNRNETEEIGRQLCDLNCIILRPDHAGHGESEGAAPTPTNLNFQGDFNQTAHNYLTICAAIQGIHVLQNIPSINDSLIVVSGISYGGLNSMFVGGIYSEHIRVVLPLISTGMLNLSSPENMIFQTLGITKESLTQAYINTKLRFFDPIAYMDKSNYPAIHWYLGTNDDFFGYGSMNSTYNQITPNEGKSLQIYPNGHHIVADAAGTLRYLINHYIFNGPGIPQISIVKPQIEANWNGDRFQAQISIQNQTKLKSVEIVYRYVSIPFSAWQRQSIDFVKNENTQSIWQASVAASWLSSDFEYYFIVNIEGPDSVWFSTPIYNAGHLSNNFAFLWIILIIGLIGAPCFFFGKINMRSLQKKGEKYQISELGKVVKERFKQQMLMLSITEVIMMSAFFLPWVTSKYGNSWSMVYLFNHFLTYADLLGVISFNLLFITIGSVGFIFIVSVWKPLWGGILNCLFWIFCTVILSFVAQGSIGDSYGFGLYQYLIGAMIQVIFAILQIRWWKRIARRIPKSES